MEFEYIIVQCGGEGTRLRPFTQNMPKALVPVNNQPMIFHLFHRYPEKKFILIGDYRNDVLNQYLEVFSDVEYVSVKALQKGNIAGIKEALSYLPDHASFLLLWSDLLLGDQFRTEDLEDGNYIGITDRFQCSWSCKEGTLEKKPLEGHGVAGCFLFRDKSVLRNLEEQGSFTRWLAERRIPLKKMPMRDTVEIGTVERREEINDDGNRCRPYNRITVLGDTVKKEALTKEAGHLLDLEIAWYKKVLEYRFPGIPRIYSMRPLEMERIHGKNVFSTRVPEERKAAVLGNLIKRLDALHRLETCGKDRFDIEKDYYQKTLKRLRGICSVIPFANQKMIHINGHSQKNPMYFQELYRSMVEAVYKRGKDFGLIHGDCTFSNTLIDREENLYFIDARGYFGNRKFLGDPDYDWAKVYYSIVGAFDQFNNRKFRLEISEKKVEFSIHPSGWEHLEDEFFRLLPECSSERIRFIHSIIWLSLASHCWEDYDSMCLAFYYGVELWNKSLEEMEESGWIS